MSGAPALVISGGSSGIGGGLVDDLRKDWDITSVSRSLPSEPLDGVTYVAGDVAGNAAQAVRDSLAAQGRTSIHSLIHCAGVGLFGPFLDTPKADWERTLMLNLNGTLNFVQGIADLVEDDGRIVLYSSGTVFKAPGGSAAYAASKAGIIGFARSFAVEMGTRNITVNVIAPGLVMTPLAAELAGGEAKNIETRAIKRASVVQDYVGPTRFFLSEGAGFVSGQTLVVDGGSIRR